METHVKVLGALQIALGSLSLLGAIVLMFVFVTGVGAMGMSGDAYAARALPFVGFSGTALVVFLVVMSLPGIVTGIGLLRLRPWARILGIVMSALFFFQAEDGIRDYKVTGVQTCALPI